MAQVCSLVEIAQRRARNASTTYCAFIDFQKAFDSVPHGALLHVIHSAGVRGRCFSFIRALYSDPNFRVRVGHLTSDSIQLQQGVRQGDPLSPILFNLFINSVLDSMQGVSVPGLAELIPGLLFADDVAVLAESPAAMRHNLQRLSAWANKWGMTVNHKKCGLMVFGRPSTRTAGVMIPRVVVNARAAAAAAQDWLVQGVSIPYVTEYKYLGVTIDCDLTFLTHVDHRASRAEKALLATRPILRHRLVPIPVKRVIYLTIVRPVLVYGAELLGGMNKDNISLSKLQHVQNKAARWIVGKSGRALFAAAPLQVDLDLPPVKSVLVAAKARALCKYPSLSTLVASLLSNRARLPTAGLLANINAIVPWSSSGRGAVSTLIGAGWHTRGAEDVSAAVLKASATRTLTAELGGTAAGKLYADRKLSETVDYLSRSSHSVYLSPLVAELTAARCNALFAGYMAARAHLADASFSERCCACLMMSRDTLMHIIVECPAYAAARAEHLQPFWERCQALAGDGVPVGELPASKKAALAVGSSSSTAHRRMWVGRKRWRDKCQIQGTAAAGALDAGAAPPGDDVPPPSTGEPGYVTCSRFFGAVLPAHRRAVAKVCDAYKTHGADAAGVAAADAQPVPNGANAFHEVGPPAAAAVAPP